MSKFGSVTQRPPLPEILRPHEDFVNSNIMFEFELIKPYLEELKSKDVDYKAVGAAYLKYHNEIEEWGR